MLSPNMDGEGSTDEGQQTNAAASSSAGGGGDSWPFSPSGLKVSGWELSLHTGALGASTRVLPCAYIAVVWGPP